MQQSVFMESLKGDTARSVSSGALQEDATDSAFNHTVLNLCINTCVAKSSDVIESAINEIQHIIRHSVQSLTSTSASNTSAEKVAKALMMVETKRSKVIETFTRDIRRHLTHNAFRSPRNLISSEQRRKLARAAADKTSPQGCAIEMELSAARLSQTIAHRTEHNLHILNGYVATLRGESYSAPNANIFKPDLFSFASRKAFETLGVTAGVAILWIDAASRKIAVGVDDIYAELIDIAKKHDVAPAQDLPIFDNVIHGDFIHAMTIHDKVGQLLTSQAEPTEEWEIDLGKLENESLLSNDNRLNSAELRGLLKSISNAGDEGATRFGSALVRAFPGLDPAAVRDKLQASARSTSTDLGPSVTKKVIGLLVDAFCEDPRLLSPVRAEIAKLKSPLENFAKKDPSILTNHAHPARAFVEFISHRSLAYTTENDPGFQAFLKPLQSGVKQFLKSDSSRLTTLIKLQMWLEEQWALIGTQATEYSEQERLIERAQDRNSAAYQVRRDIRTKLPKIESAPTFVKAFFQGPWSNVMAHLELYGGGPTMDARGAYKVLSDLIWSVDPDAVSIQRAKLVKMIPEIVQRLKTGLSLVGISPESSEWVQFEEALMSTHGAILLKSHHLITKHRSTPGELTPSHLPTARLVKEDNKSFSRDEGATTLSGFAFSHEYIEDESVWLSPNELVAVGKLDALKNSSLNPPEPTNIMSTSILNSVKTTDSTTGSQRMSEPHHKGVFKKLTSVDDAVVNGWFEIKIQDQWKRFLLKYITAENNKAVSQYMFEGANGNSITMTRRIFEKIHSDDRVLVLVNRGLMTDAVEKMLVNADVDTVV